MRTTIGLLTFIIVSFIGCSGTIKKEGDTSQSVVSIQRFDKDLYNYLQYPDQNQENEIKVKYPSLLPAFGRVAIDNNDPITLLPALREYFAHPSLLKVYNDTDAKFNDVSDYERLLAIVDDIVGQQFKGKRLPRLAMHVSGFRENVIIVDDLISLSADKYLGEDYSMYQDFFQPYERQQMKPQFVVRDYLKAWLMSDVVEPIDSDEQNLLKAMVREGKILYALSFLLPATEKIDLIGYTPEQNKWMEDHEKEAWRTILHKSYLFSDDNMLITRFINDAPFTMPLGVESPGRAGAWFGWRMVSAYARNKKVSLQNIMDVDASVILKDAKYNP
ncbi:MAG: hypothetical protein E6767_02165 [Dysgonomonas sp.]|nr:hypothetical protein [Dysgonomonas sp.]